MLLLAAGAARLALLEQVLAPQAEPQSLQQSPAAAQNWSHQQPAGRYVPGDWQVLEFLQDPSNAFVLKALAPGMMTLAEVAKC